MESTSTLKNRVLLWSSYSDRARDTKTDEIVALKKVRMDDAFKKSGFPVSALREVSILLSLNHPNVVDLREVAVGKSLDRLVYG